MANKVGTNKIFVRILLAGFLLALLLVGALLSIFYRGEGSIFILIALVVVPAVGLILMYFIQFSWIFGRDKIEHVEGDFFVPPLSNATTIVIYGSEFADPYYKQLTMPNFVGKPLPKHKKPKSQTTRTKPNKPSHIDYQDKFNGVEQTQMLLSDWTDVLRDEPIVVEQNEREATFVGELTDSIIEQYRDEISESVEGGEILLPAWDERNKGKIFSPHKRVKRPSKKSDLDLNNKQSEAEAENLSRVFVTDKVQSSVGKLGGFESGKSRKNLNTKKSNKPRKIIMHKKPKVDKRDEYVFEKLPSIDTNRPIKSLLNEQFESFTINTIHSASQELLSKMRRDNTRR